MTNTTIKTSTNMMSEESKMKYIQEEKGLLKEQLMCSSLQSAGKAAKDFFEAHLTKSHQRVWNPNLLCWFGSGCIIILKVPCTQAS